MKSTIEKSTIEKSDHPSGYSILDHIHRWSWMRPRDCVEQACDAANAVDGFTGLDRVFPATQSGSTMLLRPRSVLTPKQLRAVFEGKMKSVGTETFALGKTKKAKEEEPTKEKVKSRKKSAA